MKLLLAIAAAGVLAVACGESATPLSTSSASPGASSSPTAPAVSATKFTVKGVGSKVPHITLQVTTYVVSWTAKGGVCYGSAGCSGDNFIVDVVGGGGTSDNLVNEITSNNIKKGSSGETTYDVTDPGTYLLKVDASHLTWTVTFTPA